MRIGSFASRLAAGPLFAWLAAGCSGGDLLLPGSGTPAELRALSGDRQEAEVGATLPDPLVVLATDAAGRPVVGVEIAFRFDGDVGGDVAPELVRTDSEGEAEAQVRLGIASGAQLVDAMVVEGPTDATVTFRLTALPPDNGDGGDGGDGGGGGGDGGGDGDEFEDD